MRIPVCSEVSNESVRLMILGAKKEALGIPAKGKKLIVAGIEPAILCDSEM